MSKIIKTNQRVGDSMPPGLAKAIYEQAKQQQQQSTNTQTNQSSPKSGGGNSKNQ
ncbi:hypothetical protein [Morganella morganii]|uniref:hypothetical protein n=1 Tax=Morganella morganii TaxID=582 RepID=UPI00061F79AA|nr:hypothetical protein [Morganella morganii]EJD6109649.1 hypothetical protein [Morganella morganii]EKU4014264.1 hypothetical protein [Morganella morganii]ELA7777436.1 hypothetical protein [Morganella morganii]KJY03404.1 hypothetical protein Mm0Y_02901 [Morganella morganii]MBT0404015.1 hypothetical protein [Morganella morganii subsp. morganii]